MKPTTASATLPALLELTRMRLLLLVRAPEVIFWAFVFPILLSMVLGLAFSRREAPQSRVLLVETAGWQELRSALEGAENFWLEQSSDAAEIERRFTSGSVDVVVTPGLEPELRYDPLRSESELAHLRVREELRRGPEARPAPAASPTAARTGNRYLDWFFPGLLGLSVMSTSIWAIGFALVEARQRRLMKRFLVTPVGRASFLFSHVLGRLGLLVFELILLLAFALLVLGVPFRGSIFAFLVLCVVGATVFAGIGILLGSRVRTVEAAAGLINLSMMPMGLASGVFFTYERFPEALQAIVRILPLAALNDSLRKVMLDGLGITHVLPELAIMLVWGVGAFLAGLWVFRWK